MTEGVLSNENSSSQKSAGVPQGFALIKDLVTFYLYK